MQRLNMKFIQRIFSDFKFTFQIFGFFYVKFFIIKVGFMFGKSAFDFFRDFLVKKNVG